MNNFNSGLFLDIHRIEIAFNDTRPHSTASQRDALSVAPSRCVNRFRPVWTICVWDSKIFYS